MCVVYSHMYMHTLCLTHVHVHGLAHNNCVLHLYTPLLIIHPVLITYPPAHHTLNCLSYYPPAHVLPGSLHSLTTCTTSPSQYAQLPPPQASHPDFAPAVKSRLAKQWSKYDDEHQVDKEHPQTLTAMALRRRFDHVLPVAPDVAAA